MAVEDTKIRERIKTDNQTMQSSLYDMASLFRGDRSVLATDELRKQSARTSVEEICKYYHVYYTKESSDRLDEVDVQLDRMLRPSGYMRRSVKLEGRWWKNCRTAMLCESHDGTTVALIPNRCSGYTFFDYTLGKRIKVTEDSSNVLTSNATMFYRPLPQRKLSTKDLLHFFNSLIPRADYIAFICLSLVLIGLGLIFPLAMKYLFSIIIPSTNYSLAFSLVIMLCGVAIGHTLIEITQELIKGRIELGVTDGFQSAVMARLVYLPASFFGKYSSGELTEIINSFNKIPSAILSLILGYGVNILFSLVYLIQAYSFAPSLLAPALVVLVLQFCCSVLGALVSQRIQNQRLAFSSKLYSLVYNLYSCIQKIKSGGGEKRAFGKWASMYKKVMETELIPPFFLKVEQIIQSGLSLVGIAAFFLIASSNTIAVSDFIAFILSYSLVSASFLSLANLSSSYALIKSALTQGKALLEEVPELTSDKQFVDHVEGKIEVNNISFTYDAQKYKTLDNLSISIEPKQYVALIGRTGCGKSTLVKLLLGFSQVQEGAIYYDGRDMNTLDLPSLRRHIGVVLQNGKLLSGDILSNITIMDSNITEEQVWAAAEIAGIANDIRKMPMGLYTHISEGPGGISGGQRQRIMIARAIVANPSIVIFDEAMSSLDYLTQKQVSESLEQLDCTRIIIAHRLSTIKQCDKIFVMDRGHIVEEGTFAELEAGGQLFTSLIKRQQL